MKITKARLKEIINEELEAEMSRDPEEPDFSVSGAEDLKRSIAQHQAGRPTGEDQVADVQADLTAAYDKLRTFPADPMILDMIERLELLLQDLQV